MAAVLNSAGRIRRRRWFTNGEYRRSHGSKLKPIAVVQSARKDRRSSVLSLWSTSGLTSKIEVDDGGEETMFPSKAAH